MLHATTVVTGLLACLVIASALPAYLVQPGKVFVYNYHAVIKAGILDPESYSSQYILRGTLYLKREPVPQNAYYVVLSNVTYNIHNGQDLYIKSGRNERIPPELLEPFFIVYDKTGKLEGVKISPKDSNYVRHIKYGIVSALPLDLTMEPDAIKSPYNEHTIHGICPVVIHIQSTNQDLKTFTVTKTYEPMQCLEFVQGVFSDVNKLDTTCDVLKENDMSTASRRVFEMEDRGDHLLMKKVVSHSVVNYFPWAHRSEAHYLLTNQTFVFEYEIPQQSLDDLPKIDYSILPLEWNISYSKPQRQFSSGAAEDVTQGRHTVDPDYAESQVKSMLVNAVNYLKENHITMKEADYEHSQLLNRLLGSMKYLDFVSLNLIYETLKEGRTSKDVTSRNIFLEMVPYVGTHASAYFIKEAITKRMVLEGEAISMISKLPTYVRNPSEKLLTELEDLVKLNENVPLLIRKACILSFSSLLDRTYSRDDNRSKLFINHFYENVANHPSYEMKILFLNAMRNLNHEHIVRLLRPIITGKVEITNNPNQIRLYAILAIQNSITDPNDIYKLLWPVLADTKLPVQLRITAYEALIRQASMLKFMTIYWFMVKEKNEHLYNYHYTTIESLANSVDPCMKDVSELARKILRFTRVRKNTNDLSRQCVYDYYDTKYEYGSTVALSMKYDEMYETPSFLSLNVFTSTGRNLYHQFGVECHINIIRAIMREMSNSKSNNNIRDSLKKFINKTLEINDSEQELNIDIGIKVNGKTVMVYHLNEFYLKGTLNGILDNNIIKHINNLYHQFINYDNLYEMNVATDFGVPAVVGKMIPSLFSINIKNITVQSEPKLNAVIKMELKHWRHGQHYMSVYNPFSDAWHSIRRVSAYDLVLPIDFTISYFSEKNNFKLIIPKTLSEYYVTGVKYYAKTYVTVMENQQENDLKKYCPHCKHATPVIKEEWLKNNYENIEDSRNSLGTKFSSAYFNCATSVTPANKLKEFIDDFDISRKLYMNNVLVLLFLGSSRSLFKSMHNPQPVNCGYMFKIEPSNNYRLSAIEINLNYWKQMHKSWYLIQGQNVYLKASIHLYDDLNSKKISWFLNANGNFSQGHLENNIKVVVTRVVPGESNLMICLDAEKIYPDFEDNIFKVVQEERVTGKISLKMGPTVDDKTCPTDDMDITINFTSELTDDQKNMQNFYTDCLEDMKNPLYLHPKGLIPLTKSCYKRNVLSSTMLKYTYDINYKQVPPTLFSYLYEIGIIGMKDILSNLHHLPNRTESEHIKIIEEYYMHKNYKDLYVITPVFGYQFKELETNDPYTNLFLDSVRISTSNSMNIISGLSTFCTIYPNIIVNSLNQTSKINLEINQWNLLSLDFDVNYYAVFVKKVKDDLFDVKFVAFDYVFEIVHSGNEMQIKVNSEVVNFEKGFLVVSLINGYTFRLLKFDNYIVLKGPVKVLYMNSSVSVMIDSAWISDHYISMCGSLKRGKIN